jgi:hypothetical protein
VGGLYGILAQYYDNAAETGSTSCYIRFTPNICSFVHQCNINKQHGGHKDDTDILTHGTLTISTPSAGAHGWQKIGITEHQLLESKL